MAGVLAPDAREVLVQLLQYTLRYHQERKGPWLELRHEAGLDTGELAAHRAEMAVLERLAWSDLDAHQLRLALELVDGGCYDADVVLETVAAVLAPAGEGR